VLVANGILRVLLWQLDKPNFSTFCSADATLTETNLVPGAALPARPAAHGLEVGPTLNAILVAEIGEIAWYTKPNQPRKLAGFDIVRVKSGQFGGLPELPLDSGQASRPPPVRMPLAASIHCSTHFLC